MKPLTKVLPEIKKLFKDHPKFRKIYMEHKKLHIAFSDLILALTAMGWDIYFVETLHRMGPIETKLASAKLCKSREELFRTLQKARDTYTVPKETPTAERVGFPVDIKHIIQKRLKKHKKFVNAYASYEKLFIVFNDILILVEPIGGSFYNWELFKRQGDVEVEHLDSGSKVGFDKIVDIIMELRDKFDKLEQSKDNTSI